MTTLLLSKMANLPTAVPSLILGNCIWGKLIKISEANFDIVTKRFGQVIHIFTAYVGLLSLRALQLGQGSR